MLEALFTLVSVAFGLAYLWLKVGDAMRAAWQSFRALRMSTPAAVPAFEKNRAEQHSDAVERLGNGPEHEAGNTFPEVVPSSLMARVAALPHEELVGMLAVLKDADGEWRYAESRLAKFAGGRVEDRIAEIRVIRGTRTPPPPAARTVLVNGRERVAME